MMQSQVAHLNVREPAAKVRKAGGHISASGDNPARLPKNRKPTWARLTPKQ
jgi:hypothetical protein